MIPVGSCNLTGESNSARTAQRGNMKKQIILTALAVFVGVTSVAGSCDTRPDRDRNFGDLSEPCEPNATACDGSAVMLCDPEGRWSFVMDCDALENEAGHRFKCQPNQTGTDVACFPVAPGDMGTQ